MAAQSLGFPELRRELLAHAAGDVLEVAVGTGLNLPLYDWHARRLSSLTGVDLSQGMLAGAAARAGGIADARLAARERPGDAAAEAEAAAPGSAAAARGPVPVRLMQADVAALPWPDCSFDAVVDTFSLCTFGDPAAALAEMARVLRPGGSLLLLEHSKSDAAWLGAYQGATRGLVARLSKGCDWGQDVPALVAAVPGLQPPQLARHLAGTLVSVRAVKRA